MQYIAWFLFSPDQRKRREVLKEDGAPLQVANKAVQTSNEGDTGNQKKDGQADQKANPAANKTDFHVSIMCV